MIGFFLVEGENDVSAWEHPGTRIVVGHTVVAGTGFWAVISAFEVDAGVLCRARGLFDVVGSPQGPAPLGDFGVDRAALETRVPL